MSQSIEEQRRAWWPLPAVRETEQGAARRLGVELEFIGLPLQTVSACLQALYGGQIRSVSEYEDELEASSLGDFTIELDFSYLKRRGRERDGATEGLEDIAEGLIALVAKRLVPVEIVAPPIAMDQLWQLEDLVRAVRHAGARGTRDAAHFAFGLHLNPEMPALDARTITYYLQAFMCLYPWLMQRSQVDFSRRVTPYIDPFPKDWVESVLRRGPADDLSALIDDYLEHNPTRNRALDMLPLFAHLDEARVRAKIDDDRIKARPTLHYRVPNCQIDEPQWALVHAWRDWLQVEALAAQPERLAQACDECAQRAGRWGEQLFGNWAQAAYDWVVPELL